MQGWVGNRRISGDAVVKKALIVGVLKVGVRKKNKFVPLIKN